MKKELLLALSTGLVLSAAGITLASADTDTPDFLKNLPQTIKSSSDTQTNLANQPMEGDARKTER